MSHYDEERKADIKNITPSDITPSDITPSDIIRDFINAYEKEKYRIIMEGGTLYGVSSFASKYITRLEMDKVYLEQLGITD